MKNALGSVFFNKGENCIAAGRLFVEETIYDEFIDKYVMMMMMTRIMIMIMIMVMIMMIMIIMMTILESFLWRNHP